MECVVHQFAKQSAMTYSVKCLSYFEKACLHKIILLRQISLLAVENAHVPST